MSREHSPTFRRRLLARELRKIRHDRQLTNAQVAEAMDVRQPWISRIETGARGIQVKDLKRLLDVYGVEPGDYRDKLIGLAKEARQRGWWHAYRDVLPPQYAEYIGLEAEASEVLNFEPLSVPGLLQTADYARAMMSGTLTEMSEEEIERRVEVRMARQTLLTETPSPRLWFIIDEAALRRLVGGPEVMRAQLRHILDRAKLPRVKVQVLPLAAGAHPGTAGSFAIIRFAETSEPIPYIETIAGDLYLEKPEEIRTCNLAWSFLTAKAIGPAESLDLISRVAEEC
ncbi:helix-turn-helix domain-containing protein [Actinomadura sediminis]|uniref:Helix-turn-helix transcriptional regulator n=1 Tax=Actinomadura sediminis TaxID=1038904 RepID=A0ABW3EU25_9ACTN